MPQRMIRDWTDSMRIEQLNPSEERFFVRLMMKADDYGIFHGDPRLLKAALFPLLTDVRIQEVRQWRDKAVSVGLCHLYSDERQREFVIIHKFDQRLRAKKFKFPAPSGLLSDICPTCDSIAPLEEREKGKKETEGEEEGECEGIPPTQTSFAEIPSLEEVQAYAGVVGADLSAKKFFEYHQINNAWIKNGKLINWKMKLKSWAETDRQNGNNKKQGGVYDAAEI